MNQAKYDANKAARKDKLPLSSQDLNPLLNSMDHHLSKVPNGINGSLHLLSPINEKLMKL